MLINFSVSNFGPVKGKQTLSFEADKSDHLEDFYVIKSNGLRLLKLALIYGANASGKTTILKALNFLSNLVLNPKEKKTIEFDFEPFLFDNETPNKNSLISIEFLQKGIKYYYEIEFSKKAIVREELFFYKPNKANVFKRITNLSEQFTRINFGGKIKNDATSRKNLEANTLWNNTVLGGFLKTNINIQELKEVTEWFKNYLKPLIYTKTELSAYVTARIDNSEIDKNDVINILRKADFDISDIIIQEEEEDIPEGLLDFLRKNVSDSDEDIKHIQSKGKVTTVNLKFEHTVNNRTYDLSFDLESDGTKRYYGFSGLLSLLISKSIAFPIDELEASLHPELFTHFILSFLMNANNSQIIATTHNREILNNKDIFRDDAIWITDKGENSYTTLYSLADFDSSIIRDTTNRLNVYKSGKLGGVPNLGDIFINFD